MIKCVIHCSDIHIRNVQRIDEYLEQLDKFVEKCKEIAKDYHRDEIRILICGDLVHSKNTVSNNLFVITSHFIRSLEEIARVIVIAGNHDLLVNNTSKTDTLTALFNTANFNDAIFLDEELDYQSGCLVDNNVIWALYSIYDGFKAPDMTKCPCDENKRVVGLFHGMVLGAKLANGTTVNDGLASSLFDICDCVMAGDIHKQQTITYNDIDIVYPSSLIQQNFGEDISHHGFAVWDMETLEHKFVELESDYGLFDVEINNEDDIDNDMEILKNP